MGFKWIIGAGLAVALAACAGEVQGPAKDIVGFCKDTKCPDDGNPCTADCDEAKDKCAVLALAEASACDDGTACTTGDKCTANVCKGADVVKDDKNPCTDDTCDPKTGVAHANTSASCDDEDACTDKDKCKEGKCTAGAKKDCDDSNPCTEDEKCDSASGKCANKPQDAACSDSDKCTQDDKCVAGKCEGGDKVVTDDKNPCTADSCDKVKGVLNDANTDGCDDGNACTAGDKCADKLCKGGAVVDCPDDGKACTVEKCDKVAGCTKTNAADSTACDDNDKCTDGDACAAGNCQPGPAKKCTEDGDVCKDYFCDKAKGCTWNPATKGKPCTDDSACTDSDKCDGGACIPGTKVECNDNELCTSDSCDKKLGCKYAANELSCSDKNECTVGDVCKDSKCAPGKPTACDDDNECTKDSCDVATGKCGSTGNVKDGTACDDGSKCTEDTSCKTGKCLAATEVVCKDDGNPCTSDKCDDFKGCVYPAQAGSCDADKNVCTVGDACAGGKCVAGSGKSCDDKNVCTDDTCDVLKGCLYGNNKASCDDGLMCTEGDSCKDGGCSVNTPKNCGDGNTCTEDKCDAAKGCLNPVELDGSACDDGNACSTGDACKTGACKATGESLWVKKSGTSLNDAYHATTVGTDGTIVSVGRQFTGKDTYAPLFTGTAPDKTVKFEVKPLKAGPHGVLTGVTTTSTGAYVGVGCSDPNSQGACEHCYAVQVNANGKIDWEVECGSNQPKSTGAARANGGVVVVGWHYAATIQGRLTELNSAGKVGMQMVDKAPSPFTHQHFDGVAVAPAGGYWVGATVDSVVRILRIQDTGVVNFGTLLATPAPEKYESVSQLVADKDGVTAFGGSAYGPYGENDAWVARVDNNGKLVFKTYFGGPGSDGFHHAVAAPGGGFFVSGSWTASKAGEGLVAHVTSSGHMVWQRTFPDINWSGISLTPKGSLVLAGSTSILTAGGTDTLLATCDLYGNCDCAATGTCLTKKPADCDDTPTPNPCTLDWCEASGCKHAIGNEGLTCDVNKTCQKGKCL